MSRCATALLLAAGLTLLALSPPGAGAEAFDVEALYARHVGGVAQLTGFAAGRPVSGTGFLLNDSVLITNYHVIQGVQTLSARFPGSDYLDCKLVDTLPDYDLAAVAVLKPQPGKALSLPDKPNEEPRPGTPILLIGSPLGLRDKLSDGRIDGPPITLGELYETLNPGRAKPAQANQKVLQLKVRSTYGMSGAPVLNGDGRVLGVQKEGWQDGLGGINFAIPHLYVRKLNLAKAPTDFAGGPKLDPDFGKVGLTPPGTRPQSAVLPARGDTPPVEVGCRHWGYAPDNPNEVFMNFIGDRARFARAVPKERLELLLKRHKVVVVVNPYFRFGFLVPDNYALAEQRLNTPLGLLVTLTDKDRRVPPPFNTIRLTAWQLTEPTPRVQLEEKLREVNLTTAQRALGLRVFDPPGPAWPGPLDVIRSPAYSDVKPRLVEGWSAGRYQVVYLAPDSVGLSYAVYAAVNNTTVLAVTFEYRTQPLKPGEDDADFAERKFIAESLTLF